MSQLKKGDIYVSMLYPAVILAGGLATRLRPVTETIPKSLIEFQGEPFLAHQLRLLRKAGIRQVVLCLGYLGEMVVDYAGNGAQFDMRIDYSFDGPTLLGTGGAIKQALPLLDDRFFVIYGDSYLTCDYLAVQQTFAASGQLGLMTVFRNNGQWDTSNVEYVDQTILAYDKKARTSRMQYIDYGLGVFHQQAFASVPAHTAYDLADLYQTLLQKKQLAAYEITQRFYEVGSFAGGREFAYYLTRRDQGTLE